MQLQIVALHLLVDDLAVRLERRGLILGAGDAERQQGGQQADGGLRGDHRPATLPAEAQLETERAAVVERVVDLAETLAP